MGRSGARLGRVAARRPRRERGRAGRAGPEREWWRPVRGEGKERWAGPAVEKEGWKRSSWARPKERSEPVWVQGKERRQKV